MHMHLYVHMYMGGMAGPDMEAAEQLVHLSGDEEECSVDHSGREAKVAAAAKEPVRVGDHRQEIKMMAQVKRAAAEEGVADVDEDEDDDKRSCSRKRRFRSIAYLYKVTKPVRPFDEARRRKRQC